MKNIINTIALLFITAITYAQGMPMMQQPKDTYLVLKNATVIDVISGKQQVGNIYIKNDKIENIDYTNSLKPNKEAEIKDLTGKFIIPGLIEGHGHITQGTYQKAIKDLETALKGGVTTVREMGGDGRLLTTLKRNTLLGDILGADIFFGSIVAGQKFFDKDPRPQFVAMGEKAGEVAYQKAINNDTNIPLAIAEIKGLGATAIKVYDQMDKKLFKKVAKEAKKQGLQVWTHATVPPTRPSELVKNGSQALSHAGYLLDYEFIDEVKSSIDHNSPEEKKAYKKKMAEIKWDKNSKEVKNLFTIMKENNVALDATLLVYSGKLQKKELSNEELLKTNAFRATKIAYDMGVKIGAGTDFMIDYYTNKVGLHRELELLAIAGLSNIDVLRAATIVNAEILGEEQNIGSITKGKLANLVVLNANPLTNISNTKNIDFVIKRGSIIKK